jgi:hypothetical protein
MIYPYTFIAFMVDHYSDLCETARSRDEYSFRLDQWFYYKSLLIQYQQ